MKIKLTNIWKEESVFLLFPVVLISLSINDKGVILGWLNFAVEIGSTPKKPKSKENERV